MFKIVDRNEYYSLKAKVELLSQKNEELKNKFRKADNQALSLKLEMDNIQEEILAKTIEIENLYEEVHKLKSAKGGYSKKINQLEKRIEEQKELQKKKIAKIREEYNAIIKQKEDEILKNTIVLQQLHEDKAKLEKENNFLKKPTLGQLKAEKMYKTERVLK